MNNLAPLIILFVVLLIITCLYGGKLQDELRKYKLEQAIRKKEVQRYRLQLQNIVKDKICISREKKAIELISSHFTYKHDCVKQLEDEMISLYEKEYFIIRKEHPQITELDFLILALLALNMTNEEICSLIHMERGTLYKRRHIIATRLQISATQLEDFAASWLLDIPLANIQ